MNNTKIIILMAAYNGEKYIAKQIESIQNQSVTQWQLIVRDDSSTDRTTKIISEYIKNDNRIILLNDNKKNLGVIYNFRELIKCALSGDGDLFFFADQDDVWLPDKLHIFINKYAKSTSHLKSTTPILIHGDLQVVDSELNLIHKSFMDCVGVKPVDKNPLNRLLIQNYVTGCSMACNRALLKIGYPLPENIVMHDWWFALCAAACGKIGSILEPTIQYRKHGNNQYGSVSVFEMSNPFGTFFRDIIWKNGKSNLLDTFAQSAELKARLLYLNQCCSKESIALIDQYSLCAEQGLLKRIKFILLNRIRPNHPFATVFFFFKLIFFLPFKQTDK